MKQILFMLCCLSALSALHAQNQETAPLRRGFLMGANEEAYDALRSDYARTLLTVCENDEAIALKHWFDLMKDMEDYAQKIDFDLNGLKLYLNVFWNTDGKVDNIGFFPMPESRNVAHEDLAAFSSSFMRQYPAMSLESDKKFSHYTFVSFPTFAQRKQ